MRAWPSGFLGLKLRVASGWYPLPAHMPVSECAALRELLQTCVDGVEFCVELDWRDLDDAETMQLTKALVVVRVPFGIEPGDEAMHGPWTKLGGVRLGLLHYTKPGTWPETAWQQQLVKAPLMTWIKRQLRRSDHPLAEFAVAKLPVDRLSELTAEPVELWLMVEATLDHRLRYRAQGLADEDWARSVTHVAGERLALRLGAIAADMQARALDLALVKRDEGIVSTLEDYAAGRALAEAGLAWHGGDDLMLGPLVQLALDHSILERLLVRLPETAWSERGKRALREALPVFLPRPRAVLVTPDPPYSRWPAVVVVSPFLDSRGGDLRISIGLERLADYLHAVDPAEELERVREQLERAPKEPWWQSVSVSLTALMDLEDESLLALDLERGRLHRFDAVDRAWAKDPEGPMMRAYVRWLGLTRLLARALTHDVLDVILSEVVTALELMPDDGQLKAALLALQGDVWSRRGDLSAALDCWKRAEARIHDVLSRSRLWLRQALLALRRDDFEQATSFAEKLDEMEETLELFDTAKTRWARTQEDFDVRDQLDELLDIQREFANKLVPEDSQAVERMFSPTEAIGDSQALRVTRCACALEYGDWPHALAMLATLDRDPSSPVGARAELLWAWVQVCLGEFDAADASFALLLEQPVAHGDLLLRALVERGRAEAAIARQRIDAAHEHLRRACEVERELGLPDAELLEIELAVWGPDDAADKQSRYRAVIDRFEASSPSLVLALVDSQLRMIATILAAAEATRTLVPDAILATLDEMLASGVVHRELMPWLARTHEVLLGLAESGDHTNADALRATAERIMAALGHHEPGSEPLE